MWQSRLGQGTEEVRDSRAHGVATGPSAGRRTGEPEQGPARQLQVRALKERAPLQDTLVPLWAAHRESEAAKPRDGRRLDLWVTVWRTPAADRHLSKNCKSTRQTPFLFWWTGYSN